MNWEDKGWEDAARQYHSQRGNRTTIVEIEPERLRRLRRLLGDDVSLERAWHELNAEHFRSRAAQSTIEALMFGLRERGTAALAEPKVRSRLAQLSESQLIEVGDRLQRLKPEIAHAWSADEVAMLVDAWGEAHP